jgi:pilus assembly protein CpaF
MTEINKVHQKIIHLLEQKEVKVLTPELIKECAHLVFSEESKIGLEEKSKVIDELTNLILGWGPLTNYLKDPEIEEIMVNGCENMFLGRQGRLEQIPSCFKNNQEILRVINRMVGQVGRRIDVASPMVDARLPDGSRINAIIEPLSLKGPILTIRKFPANPFDINDLIKKETLSQEMADFLKTAVQARKNIIISGGTASGKTTTLNAIASLISSEERLITIEDVAEINLKHNHLISLEVRLANLENKGEVSLRALLRNSLRMRPDRIIIGEIRGGEALDMLQAMNTGHQGSISTVHANSPLDTLLRIETMALMAEIDLPLSAIRSQIRQALNILVQQERLPNGRRVITHISELSDQSKDVSEYLIKNIFSYDKKRDKFIKSSSGKVKPFKKKVNKIKN